MKEKKFPYLVYNNSVVIFVDKIVSIEHEKNKCFVYLVGGRTIELLMSLEKLLETLEGATK